MTTHDLLSQLKAKCEFDGINKAACERAAIARGFQASDGSFSGFVTHHTEGFADGALYQSTKDRAIMDALIEVVQMQAKALAFYGDDREMNHGVHLLDDSVTAYINPDDFYLKESGIHTFLVQGAHAIETQAAVDDLLKGILG